MLKSFKLDPSAFNIVICVFLGLLIGLSTACFLFALDAIANVQISLNSETPLHLLLLPLVVVIIDFVRRHTLYFPAGVAQLREDNSSAHWSGAMWPYHFLGTLASHLSGASVGREGAVVLFSAALVRNLKLQWSAWGPVCAASGFACITGQLWVAPFFMSEMFGRTNWLQKVFVVLCSWVALLVTDTMSVKHLFVDLDPDLLSVDIGFFTKLLGFFLLAAFFGYTMRLYKYLHSRCAGYFRNSGLWVRLSVAVVVALVLALPQMRIYQSLGLAQLAGLELESARGLLHAIVKLFLTLLATTLGLAGGEFIPLVYSGAHLGSWFFQVLGIKAILGAAMGAYLLFAAGTRFKWTSYVLLLSLLGLGWWFWAYFTVAVAIGFSGSRSLYKNSHF
jgi:H+/Cl- antiporter ClcA